MANGKSNPLKGATEPLLLTVQQLADFLQVPKQSIYNWSSQGRLDFCKRRFGRHVRFVRALLIARLEKGGLDDDAE